MQDSIQKVIQALQSIFHTFINCFIHVSGNNNGSWEKVWKPSVVKNSFKQLQFQPTMKNDSPSQPHANSNILNFGSFEDMKKNGPTFLLRNADAEASTIRLTIPVWHSELKGKGLQVKDIDFYRSLPLEELSQVAKDLNQEYCKYLHQSLLSLCVQEGYFPNKSPMNSDDFLSLLKQRKSIPEYLGLLKVSKESKQLQSLVDVKGLQDRFASK